MRASSSVLSASFSVAIWLVALSPPTPPRASGPASPLLRKRSSNASYSGLPWYLSLSPMKTRISVRSPRNDSVMQASQESVGERGSQYDRDDTAKNGGAHVDSGPEGIAIAEPRDAL